MYMAGYLEAGTTANSARYIEKLKHLRRRVCRVRNCTNPIILQHDNARSHDCVVFRSLSHLLLKLLKDVSVPFFDVATIMGEGD